MVLDLLFLAGGVVLVVDFVVSRVRGAAGCCRAGGFWYSLISERRDGENEENTCFFFASVFLVF